MVSPQRRKEASSVATTFHVAIALLGARTYLNVLALWGDVVPTQGRVRSTGETFWSQALNLMRIRRSQVEAITLPFLRLFRALLTGFTFQSLSNPVLTAVPLSMLRQDFYDALLEYAPEALDSGLLPDLDIYDSQPAEEISDPDGSDYDPYNIEEWLDDLDIHIETLKDLEEILNELQADLDAEAQAVIDNLGPKRLEQILEDLSQDDKLQSPRETEAEREDAHQKVGNRVAAHADRIVQNSARHAETAVGRIDPRVKGFVRVHYPRGDVNPCGFCALLLTRGFVGSQLYKSFKSAGGETNDYGENPDEYHANCHCRAEEVFDLQLLEDDPRFGPNRAFADLYEQKIQGRYSGKKAMSAWRHLIRKRADQASA